MTIIPVTIERILNIYNIFEFLRPKYLKISISLFSKNLIKKSCIVISIINGNKSNKRIGEFINDKNNVKLNSTFSFLKNSSSLNILRNKTKLLTTKKTNKRDLKKIIDINLMYTLML